MAASPPSSSPAAVAKPPTSTVAAAGAHNSYIWTKFDYYFPWRLGSDGSPRCPTVDAGDDKERKLRWLRVAVLVIALGTSALSIVNLLILPINLIAFSIVVFSLLRSGRYTPWHPLILRASEYIVAAWMGLVAVLLEGLGMQVVVTGDVPATPEQFGEGALILSNHPTTADWLFLWSWLLRYGDISRLKIVLKAALHTIPIVGWGLQTTRYLFLQRDWEKDQQTIGVTMKHWAGRSEGKAETKEANPIQLLLFAEGTDLRPVSYDQSVAYAQKTNSTQFQHVLQPRTTGFIHMVKLLRETGNVKAVYDVTLGTSPIPLTIENLFRGVLPKRMHYHVVRYELSSLPQTDAELAEWLFARWNEKDVRLERFYSQPNETRVFDQTSEQKMRLNDVNTKYAQQILFRKFTIGAFFALLGLFHLIAFYKLPFWVLLFHILASGIWIGFAKRYGGMDKLILKVEDSFLQHSKDTPVVAASKPVGSNSNKNNTTGKNKKAN